MKWFRIRAFLPSVFFFVCLQHISMIYCEEKNILLFKNKTNFSSLNVHAETKILSIHTHIKENMYGQLEVQTNRFCANIWFMWTNFFDLFYKWQWEIKFLYMINSRQMIHLLCLVLIALSSCGVPHKCWRKIPLNS